MTEHLELRPAKMDDAALIFRWRNDPFIVVRGSSQRRVTWEEHRHWFGSSLNSAQRRIYVVTVDGDAAGQVRFDKRDDLDCVISAYLLERWSGRGLGVRSILRGCDLIFRAWPVQRILAFVREDNPPAQAAFRKAGFAGMAAPGDCPAGHLAFVLERIASQ